jgi:urate oxidase
MSSIAVLGANCHGKGRVRVVKVKRTPERHYVQQLKVEILVEGEAVSGSYYTGDNSQVLATDTIKNMVYVLAKKHEFDSMEEFGIIVAKFFVTQHKDQMSKATVKIVDDNWVRVQNEDSQGRVREHHHAFVRSGSEERFCTVVANGKKYGQPDISVMSGLRELKVMKTTQSSFFNFKRDEFTTLPDTADRLVGTEVTATWRYNDVTSPRVVKTFQQQAQDVRDTLVDVFAGPADIGSPSPAVQYSLFKMGEAVLHKYPNIVDITMNMPNVHNLPYDQSKFGLHNEHPHGEIFVPVDEPHGIIEATVTRPNVNTVRARL